MFQTEGLVNMPEEEREEKEHKEEEKQTEEDNEFSAADVGLAAQNIMETLEETVVLAREQMPERKNYRIGIVGIQVRLEADDKCSDPDCDSMHTVSLLHMGFSKHANEISIDERVGLLDIARIECLKLYEMGGA